MKKPDVIIILGGGTSDSLKPVLYTKERLEGFKKASKHHKDIPIIVSGRYSLWLKKKPKYTEADVMENYLLDLGIPKSLILKENKSRDTVGNIYFSKLILNKHPGWSKILVVTTKGHDVRTDWLLRKIFGKKYVFSYLPIPSKIHSFKSNPGRKKYEQTVMGVYKRLLRNVKGGDERAVMKLLKQKHPAYSKTPAAKRLEQEIFAAKLKLMGSLQLPKQ